MTNHKRTVFYVHSKYLCSIIIYVSHRVSLSCRANVSIIYVQWREKKEEKKRQQRIMRKSSKSNIMKRWNRSNCWNRKIPRLRVLQWRMHSCILSADNRRARWHRPIAMHTHNTVGGASAFVCTRYKAPLIVHEKNSPCVPLFKWRCSAAPEKSGISCTRKITVTIEIEHVCPSFIGSRESLRSAVICLIFFSFYLLF